MSVLKWLRKAGSRRHPDMDEPGPATDDSEKGLLKLALTHRSVSAVENNERLEFLGDAVLQLIVTEHLYTTYPKKAEGELTRSRIGAVSEPTLADAARRHGLGQRIRMGRGEETGGGRDRASILSDAFEAVIAAIYLTDGMDAARAFVLEHLAGALGAGQERDFKSRLQELTQGRYRTMPEYRTVEEKGPDHAPFFVVAVVVNGEVIAGGRGTTRKAAEQGAASMALAKLTESPSSGDSGSDAPGLNPDQNPKSRLQEWIQKRFGTTPTYRTVEESGPEHARLYVVAVDLESQELAQGRGTTKKGAEQEAASQALAKLIESSVTAS